MPQEGSFQLRSFGPLAVLTHTDGLVSTPLVQFSSPMSGQLAISNDLPTRVETKSRKGPTVVDPGIGGVSSSVLKVRRTDAPSPEPREAP